MLELAEVSWVLEKDKLRSNKPKLRLFWSTERCPLQMFADYPGVPAPVTQDPWLLRECIYRVPMPHLSF